MWYGTLLQSSTRLRRVTVRQCFSQEVSWDKCLLCAWPSDFTLSSSNSMHQTMGTMLEMQGP